MPFLSIASGNVLLDVVEIANAKPKTRKSQRGVKAFNRSSFPEK